MADYPYTTVPGKLKVVLAKIREVGIPPKATQKWLLSVGFKSNNDRSVLPVLKQIGFIDSTGVPSELWKQYRGADHKQVLARGIRQGYSDLFNLYPNASERSNSDLENYFSTRSSAGKQAISKTVTTFKALCELADFGSSGALQNTVASTNQEDQMVFNDGNTAIEPGGAIALSRTVYQGMGTSLTININIQLALPDTTDPNVYENFFASLKKHLLPQSETND